MKRRLLNTQRRQLHEALVAAGVDPSTSKWTSDTKGWTLDVVETLEIGLCYFLFNPDHDGYLSIKCRPGGEGLVEFGEVGLSWNAVLLHFQSWSKLVKTEMDVEDPWSKYAAFIPPGAVSDATDNSPFSHVEAEDAIGAITGLRAYIEATVPGYADVQASFDPQFERMSEAARKGAGRIDWSNQFVGLLISLCVVLSLDPQKAAEIWGKWMELITRLLPP